MGKYGRMIITRSGQKDVGTRQRASPRREHEITGSTIAWRWLAGARWRGGLNDKKRDVLANINILSSAHKDEYVKKREGGGCTQRWEQSRSRKF